MKSTKSTVVIGNAAQVDVCPGEAGFVLSVGPLSLWLTPAAARDVVATLARALLLEAPGQVEAEASERAAVRSRRAPDRRAN